MKIIKTKKPIVIDLFAGAGGLSEGLLMAGWDVALAVERDLYATETYKYNHNDNKKNKRKTIILKEDIETLSREILANALRKARGISLDEVDLIAGGPPCQGFSHIGQRLLTDPRNRLFFHFVRIIGMVRPKAFIAENVKGILSFAGGRIPVLLERIFEDLGYLLSYDLINSKDFGVPQDRPRVLFLGVRQDVANSIGHVIRMPDPCMPPPLKDKYHIGHIFTVGEAISDLPRGSDVALEERIWVSDDGKEYTGKKTDFFFDYHSQSVNAYQTAMRKKSKAVYDNHTKGISMDRLNKISLIPEGGSAASPGRNNAWRRLSWTRLSHTLQAHMGRDLKEFIHPGVNRWITIREAARIQSFGDTYRFIGPQSAQLRQIGNAVPPFLGWAIGRTIGEELGFFKRKIVPKKEPVIKPVKALFQESYESLSAVRETASLEDADVQIAQTLHSIFDSMIEAAASSNKK